MKRMYIIVVFFLTTFFSVLSVTAQNILNIPITGTFHDVTIFEFLETVEQKHDVTFFYDPGKLPYYRQSARFDQEPLFRALEKLLQSSNLDVIKYKDAIFLAKKLFVTAEELDSIMHRWQTGMYQKPISDELQTVFLESGQPGDSTGDLITLQGIITDKYSADPIIGAVVQEASTGSGTTTDANGMFQLSVSPGQHQYIIRYLGYQPIAMNLDVWADTSFVLQMQVHSLNLRQVVVEATQQQSKVDGTSIGFEAISMRRIKELPSFLGQADIIRGIEQLPGVSTAGEASAGFNVRGGAIDQNLVLLDDALIFNANHALGIFSVFNADAIRNVSLYKGYIPAQYGGRLSSVLQAEVKDGHYQQWSGAGSLGLASAGITVNGPLSDKTAMVAGLRSSHAGWLLKLLRQAQIRKSNVYFGDALVKLSHKLSDKHSLHALGYYSRDLFQFSDEFGYKWATTAANLRWRYLLSEELTMTSSLTWGRYASQQFTPEGPDAFRLQSGLQYVKAKSMVNLAYQKHFIHAGGEAIRLKMHPEEIFPYHSNSGIEPDRIDRDQGYELAVFADDDFKLSDAINLQVGIRYAYYLSLGPGYRRHYQTNQPRSASTLVESEFVDEGKRLASYQGLEPRIAMHWQWNSKKAIKVAYYRARQYLQLVSNTASAAPADIWQLVNDQIRPQTVDHYSAGLFQQWNPTWSGSLELFYKQYQDLPQFKDLADLVFNPLLETEILRTEGRSWGIELGLEKATGSWKGMLAYTYSRSEARTSSNFQEERINGNRWFPAFFDQPHNLSLQISHALDPVQSLQFGFNYRSGRPITLPVANYAVQQVLITHFSDRNQFRVPAYHRLDFAYVIDRSKGKLKGFKSSITLSFYNLYFRRNPFLVYFARDTRNIQRAYQLSILGTTFPSLTWNFNF